MGGLATCEADGRRRTPVADSAEVRYLEARQQLRSASERLASLDERAAADGKPLDRGARLTAATDPTTAARELLARDWPDRVELHEIVTAYLHAHSLSREAWAQLPPATQMRLAQPREN